MVAYAATYCATDPDGSFLHVTQRLVHYGSNRRPACNLKKAT